MVVRLERPTRSILTCLAAIAGIALAWVLLFHANSLFTGLLGETRFASWIFLPAAVRILAVMLFGWRASIGLFLGTFVTGVELGLELSHVFALALISAIAPLCAADICQRLLALPTDFSGLRPAQLGVFALAAAMANTLFTQAYLVIADLGDGCASCIGAMFVGDLLGTAAVLFTAQLALRSLFPRT